MNNKNKYKTTILGSEYTFVASDDEQYLEKLCTEVKERMNDISKNHNLKPMKASVLTAINLCDELVKSRERIEALENELAAYLSEEEKLKREISVLEEEKKYLKNVISSNRLR